MTLAIDGIADDLALQGGRQLPIAPWHFTPIDFREDTSLPQATKWIWENLSGRFSINYKVAGYDSIYVASFEDESEASAFTISLPLMAETW